METVRKRLSGKGIGMAFTEKAADYLAKEGYDPAFGARPLKRVIQEQILDELALRIIEGKIEEGDTVRISADENGIIIGKA